MLITLLVAAACAILAYRRGRSWWLWGLAGMAINVAVAVLLAVGAAALKIDLRFASGNNVGIASAMVALLLPPILALLLVSRLARAVARDAPPARASSASRSRSARR